MGFRNPFTGLAPGSVTADELADGAVTGSKLAADAIDGKVITGATVQTAKTGQRTVMDTSKDLAFYTGTAGEKAPGELDVYGNTVMLKGPAFSDAAAGSYQNALFLTHPAADQSPTATGRLVTMRTARVDVEGPSRTVSLDVSQAFPSLDLAGGSVKNGTATLSQLTLNGRRVHADTGLTASDSNYGPVTVTNLDAGAGTVVYRVRGERDVEFYLVGTYTGASVSVPANGNNADIALATLPAGLRPPVGIVAHGFVSPTSGTFFLDTDGSVRLLSVAPGTMTSIDPGRFLRAYFSYSI